MFKDKDKKLLFLGIAIIIVHLFYYAIAFKNGFIYMADSYEYLQQSLNIRNYSSFYCLDFNQPLKIQFFTKRPPMYGLFILTLKSLIYSDFFVLFMQNVLSLINIYGLLKILEKFKFSFNAQKTLLCLGLFLPFQYIYCNMIMSEILMQSLIFWSFYYFILYIKEGNTVYVFAYNIFLTLAVLTKPVLLYFWIINFLLLFIIFMKRRKLLPLIAGAIMPIAIFLYSWYNFNVTGSFHYSSIKQMSLIGYNSAFLLVNIYGEEEGQRKISEIRDHLKSIENFQELQKEEDKIGYEIIMSHKYEYAKYHMKGMVNYLLDPGRFDINNFLGVKEENNSGLLYVFTKEGYLGVLKFILKQPIYVILYLLFVMIINILLLISFINFISVKNINIEIKLFLVLMIFYMCFFSGPLGTMRYKIHVIPLMLFTVPFLIEKIKYFFSKKHTVTSFSN